MKSPFLPYLFLVFFLGPASILSSCKEFIEPSIAQKKVQPEAPGNAYQSTSYAINFWWDNVEDALSYRLQVVTPAFDTIGGLVEDTLIKGNKFIKTLDPGEYEWRVRAENGSSQTAYSEPRKFTVLASSLTNQSLILISPANNLATNQGSIVFKWNALFGATKYQVEIDTNNFINENSMLYNQTIPGQQLNFKFPKDQVYAWRVRAGNETEQSKWSVVNYITYDSSPPPAVTLNTPVNGEIVNTPVILKWNASPGASGYKLYLYKSDATTLYSPAYPMALSAVSYSLSTANSGEKIYWRVTATDAVGNESSSVETRNFTVQ